jgi:hypothetical protein
MAQYGVYPFSYAPAPAYDPMTYKLVDAGFVSKGTTYTNTWSLVELSVAEKNDRILEKIADIESRQARAVREAALGDTAYLHQINDQIVALRAQMVRQ